MEEFYQNILFYFERDEELKQHELVGLDTIKFIILQKNNDVIPFFKFISNKFSNLSPS